MSVSKPRYYKWYPTVSCDLGAMPFEGDFTINDKIVQNDAAGIQKIYSSNASGTEFGRVVPKQVGHRIQNVWVPGVTVGPVVYVDPTTQEEVQAPVWFMYYGSGVCVAKLPAGEQPEPVEI